MHLSIPSTKKQQLFEQLQHANLAFQQRYPGDLPNRQAVHTVYGGANLFKHDLPITYNLITRSFSHTFIYIRKINEIFLNKALCNWKIVVTLHPL